MILSGNVNIDRRRFVGTAAMAAAAVQLGIVGCARSGSSTNGSSEGSASVTQTATGNGATAIRPFPQLHVPEVGPYRFTPSRQRHAVADRANSS